MRVWPSICARAARSAARGVGPRPMIAKPYTDFVRPLNLLASHSLYSNSVADSCVSRPTFKIPPANLGANLVIEVPQYDCGWACNRCNYPPFDV